MNSGFLLYKTRLEWTSAFHTFSEHWVCSCLGPSTAWLSRSGRARLRICVSDKSRDAAARRCHALEQQGTRWLSAAFQLNASTLLPRAGALAASASSLELVGASWSSRPSVPIMPCPGQHRKAGPRAACWERFRRPAIRSSCSVAFCFL